MRIRKSGIYKIAAYTALVTVALQAALIFVSWIVAAAFPQLGTRSLLSGEGLRRLVGRSVDYIGSPLLTWILLAAMSLGALWRSGLWAALRGIRHSDYRERLALRFVAGELCLFAAILFLLTAVPHAALLNVTGHLLPSSFTSGLMPMLAVIVCVLSVTYGVAVGRLHTAVDMFQPLVFGIEAAAPVLADYMLLVELYQSALFVSGL